MNMIMATPSERQKIWDRRMAIWDYNTSIHSAKAEGLNEGLQQGKILQTISMYHELSDFDNTRICQEIMTKFNLTREEADKYMAMQE